MRTFCAILLGLLSASSASAINWQPVPGLEPTVMDNQEFRLDMDSILKNERIASVWTMMNYPKPQVETKPWGEVVKYQSTMERLLFKCAEDTFQIESSINYSGKNGEGGPVERLILPPHKQKFRSSEGSTFLSKIKAIACAKAD